MLPQRENKEIYVPFFDAKTFLEALGPQVVETELCHWTMDRIKQHNEKHGERYLST